MVFSTILALDLFALCLLRLRRFSLLLSFKSLLRHHTWCKIDNKRITFTNRLQGTSFILGIILHLTHTLYIFSLLFLGRQHSFSILMNELHLEAQSRDLSYSQLTRLLLHKILDLFNG